MTKHTPGPWEPYLPGRKFVHSVRNFNSICELNTYDREPDVVDANARLIAAAPDLLALLEDAYDALPHGDLTTRIALALAKAKGE